MFSTSIPLAFRFCTDGCPSCHRTINLPIAHSTTRDNGTEAESHIKLTYACECGRTWFTWWSKQTAKQRSTHEHLELLEAGVVAKQGVL
jgi:hypothetical protein